MSTEQTIRGIGGGIVRVVETGVEFAAAIGGLIDSISGWPTYDNAWIDRFEYQSQGTRTLHRASEPTSFDSIDVYLKFANVSDQYILGHLAIVKYEPENNDSPDINDSRIDVSSFFDYVNVQGKDYSDISRKDQFVLTGPLGRCLQLISWSSSHVGPGGLMTIVTSKTGSTIEDRKRLEMEKGDMIYAIWHFENMLTGQLAFPIDTLIHTNITWLESQRTIDGHYTNFAQTGGVRVAD